MLNLSPWKMSALDLNYLENFNKNFWKAFSGAEICQGFCSKSRHRDMLVAKLENICLTQMITFGSRSKNQLNNMTYYCRLTPNHTCNCTEQQGVGNRKLKEQVSFSHLPNTSPWQVTQLVCASVTLSLKRWDNNNSHLWKKVRDPQTKAAISVKYSL